MEANKLDAYECLHRAENLLTSGSEADRTQAVIFLKKSIRLYPSDKANKLLDHVMSTMSSPRRRNSDSTNSNNKRSNTTKASFNTTLTNGDSINDDNRSDEQQQLAMKMVKNGKTLYDMLGVSNTASDKEISKSYRKLALLLHPDKNKVTGSADCFKAIARAFKILKDPKSRSDYDRSLSVSQNVTIVNHQAYRRHHHQYQQNPFNVWNNDDDFSAEDFFNAFFTNSHTTAFFTTARSPHIRRQGNAFQRVPNGRLNESFNTLKYFTMALLFFIFILSVYLRPSETFSFSSNELHYIRRTTSRIQIVYYVTEYFDANKIDLKSFEFDVERSYIKNLEEACHAERQSQYYSMLREQLLGKFKYSSKKTRLSAPSCDELKLIKSKLFKV